MHLIHLVSHTWSATIRMFPNNSRSAIPVKTKTKISFFVLIKVNFTGNSAHITPILLPVELLQLRVVLLRADGPHWQTSASWPHPAGRPLNRVLHDFQDSRMFYNLHTWGKGTHQLLFWQELKTKTRITLYLLLFLLELCTENPAQSLGWQLEMVTWVSWSVHETDR